MRNAWSCATSVVVLVAGRGLGPSPTSSRADPVLLGFFEGLGNGALYALIALGYTLVYGIIELINFAHGDLFMLGTCLAASCLTVQWFGLTEPGARSWACWRWSLVGVHGVLRTDQRRRSSASRTGAFGGRPSSRR